MITRRRGEGDNLIISYDDTANGNAANGNTANGNTANGI